LVQQGPVVSSAMNEPLVSVGMAVCNVERFLPEAIESVLAQTLSDFELIVVDFGSTDRSKEIAQAFAAKDSRVRVHQVSPCGLPEARNAAFRLARGRFFAVMDADDVCLPQRLQREVEFMEAHPEIGLLGGATDWIDAQGRSLGVRSFPTEDREIRSELTSRFPFCHPTILLRRATFEAIGGYRKAFVCGHDYDLGARIAEKSRCANLDQVVLQYRIHPHQISLQRQRQQTLSKLATQAAAERRAGGLADGLDLVDQITPSVLDQLGVPKDRVRSTLAADRRNWIRSMAAAGEYSAALETASDLLRDHDGVETWQIADLRLTMARLYWKQGRFFQSVVSAVAAVAERPLILGRPLKGLWPRAKAGQN